jgi:hypothetical protein
MSRFPNLRPLITLFFAVGAILPIAICLVLGVGALLSQMGDVSGGFVLNRICLALSILWVLDLIVLVLFQALDSISRDHQNHDDAEKP